MNEALKTAKPILFNTEMVQAILDGRKTVTRRILKTQLPSNVIKINEIDPLGYISFQTTDRLLGGRQHRKCQYCPGDILYVRETWCKTDCFGLHNGYVYKANDNSVLEHTGFIPKWKPSIHMPKEAARIFLRVTNVRVERLQDITDEQVVAEGIDIPKTANNEERCLLGFARYSKLWNSTVKKSDLNEYGWNANPFVQVIEFERV